MLVHLTPIEWELLRALMSHAGRTLTHRQLFHDVWSGRQFGDAQQYLRVHVAHLRRKIESDSLRPRYIHHRTRRRLPLRHRRRARVRAVTGPVTERRAERWYVWLVVTIAGTAALLLLRARPGEDPRRAGATCCWCSLAVPAPGCRVGLALSVASFLLFDWFFVPPYNTLYVRNAVDWFVLVSFLIVSVVAARLLFRFQREAEASRQRAAEIDHFATLGAGTINVARAGDALSRIADVIRDTLGIAACRIHRCERRQRHAHRQRSAR